MVDIARDARWGRITEGAGEDPYLGSAMARAYVRGYQGTSLSEPTSLLACLKHYVGYGAAEGARDYNTTEIPERLLRDVYLPPFKAGLDEGAATVMSAFNALNGVPSSANAFTLHQSCATTGSSGVRRQRLDVDRRDDRPRHGDRRRGGGAQIDRRRGRHGHGKRSLPDGLG